MRRTLTSDITDALRTAQEPLTGAAAVVREAFAVDRVSIARIDRSARRFAIAAEAGAELLAPGTALPIATCSYFAETAEGRAFHDDDFDASRAFELPLDSVVLAAGFHAGCSVPVVRDGGVVGAVSLSAAGRPGSMTAMVEGVRVVGDLVARALAAGDPTPAPRVLICHADELVGRGLARLAELDDGARVEVAATLPDALGAARRTPPDVVVCDDWLDGVRVDAVARALRDAGTDAPLLVVSSRDTPDSVRASLAARASGYVPRRDAVAHLPVALAAVRSGRTLLPAPPAGDDPHLTHRERELLEALDEGLRFKQVARRLGISEATAKTHGRNLFRKLGATSRAEAVHAARHRGLLA